MYHSINHFSARRIIDEEELPTRYSTAAVFGSCGLKTLYLLTAKVDASIYTGQVNSSVTVSPPAGSLIIMRGMGKGMRVNLPCFKC